MNDEFGMMNTEGKAKDNSAFSTHHSSLNTPAIRFKGFGGEWVEKRLDEITIYIKGFAFKSADYRSTGTRIVRVSDLTTNDLVESNENSTYIDNSKANQYYNYRIKDGDIVITTVGSKAEMRDSAVGRAIIFNKNKGFLLNQNLVKLSAKEQNNSRFIHVQLLREQYAKFIEDIQRGNANQANIAINDLWEYLVYCPNPKEQTQIGNFFQQLDRLIAQHQQKHDKLQCVKKALLAKMFPKQGETQPAIRFKGFSAAWEVKTLGDVGFFVSGTGFPENEQNGKFGIPYFKVSDMNNIGNEQEMIFSNNYVDDEQVARLNYKPILEKSVIFAKVGAAIFLERKRIASNFLIDNNMMAYTPLENICFTKLWFDSIDLAKYAQVGALPSFNASDLKIIPIWIPEKEEQTQIGKLFQQLDSLITQQQTQLTKLNNIKQSMLAKMFV